MLLDELNQEQRAAAQQTEGAVMIVAGAGSGKTRTLTYRIAYLLEKGVDPFNILSLTFTNKAAKEMKDRIISLVGPKARNIMMGTFHSVFAKVLRAEAERLGYISTFTIYDSDDSKGLIKNILKDHSLDPKTYNPGYVLSRISKAKSSLISPSDYLDNQQLMTEDKASNKPYIGNIYQEYNNRLRKAMSMDFDDLLFNMNILLRDFPDLLLKYQDKFRYILVDEYQDTNFSQYLIIKKLAARYGNICVVGDDAQSIYSFRGANIQNILNFKKDYPDCGIYKLEQNYRSTQTIVKAANSVIAKNRDQIKKEVWTSNEEGHKINYNECENEKEEARWICKEIVSRIQTKNSKFQDFAILYRTNQQSRSLEEVLRLYNIPYRIYSGTSFYDRKEIRDVLAYFRLVVNNSDDEAFLRVINFPTRGIGDTSINRLKILADQKNCSLFEAALNLSYTDGIHARTAQKIVDFALMLRAYTIDVFNKNAYDIGFEIVAKSNIIKHWKEDPDPQSSDRADNIEELLNAVQGFVESSEDAILDQLTGEEISIENKTLDVFLQQVSLMSETDRDDNGENERVSLMTIHAAKGLEFPYVFVCGMEENLFPSIMTIVSRVDLEEERRLFYVAMTRAQTELLLSCANSRFKNGQLNFNERSRFLEEIDQQYFNEEIRMGKKSANPFAFKQNTTETFVPKKIFTPIVNKPLPKPIGGNPVSIEEFFVGMDVAHDKFGFGKIIAIEGTGDDTKAEVNFEAFGTKKLVLRFAKLKKI
ncbi:MAG: UvrD/REP helicase [Bacteroidetes bacterium]|nr:UvrD/REP helicase [Bacteroidota bacterium]